MTLSIETSDESHKLSTHLNTQWDSDISIEIRRRVQVHAWVGSNLRHIGSVRSSLRDGEEGLVQFFNDWVWTFDPRNDPPRAKHLPFMLWPKQDKFLRWIYHTEIQGENGLCDKSRDTGVTWLVAGYIVWRWLTEPGWICSIGSRKAQLMEKLGDPKSFFWKIKYIIDELPVWMRPAGYNVTKHSHYGRVQNPETGAVIAGEVGDEQGRGGRSSLYVLDEFGKMPRATSVLAAVSGNARAVVFVSTAVPPGTEFHRLAHDPHIRKIRLTWKDDPRLLPTWRDWHLRKYGSTITAQEVDVDYGASVSDSVIPALWVLASVGVNLGDPETYGRASTGLDVADTGQDENVITVRQGPYALFQQTWTGINTTDTAHRAHEISQNAGAKFMRFDAGGVGAGVRGALATVNEKGCKPVPVNFGWKPSVTYYSDYADENARERFGNLRAEMYWALRLRFEKTYRYVEKLDGWEDLELSDLISIPDDSLLVSQLSMTQIVRGDNAKVFLESKKSMRSRGLSSPDRADSIVLAFADMVRQEELLIGFI